MYTSIQLSFRKRRMDAVDTFESQWQAWYMVDSPTTRSIGFFVYTKDIQKYCLIEKIIFMEGEFESTCV